MPILQNVAGAPFWALHLRSLVQGKPVPPVVPVKPVAPEEPVTPVYPVNPVAPVFPVNPVAPVPPVPPATNQMCFKAPPMQIFKG
jgi:hypothetical protein